MADSDSHGGWKAYEYYPSMAAAVIFILLFIVVDLLHTYHLVRTRTWFFIPLVIGGWFEFLGYIGRAMSAKQSPDWTIGPYVMQSTLLLVAPALFAASIYMELGRIIYLVKGQSLSLIRVNWMTKIFVGGDVLSAGIMVNGSQSTGKSIILGGLFVQIIFFGFFLVSAIVFQTRIGKHPTAQSVDVYIPWRKHMFALHASSVLILIRSIFRVAEYVGDTDGVLMTSEAFIYIFDGLLMFLMMVIFVVIHPSEVNYLLGKGTYMTIKGGLGVSRPNMPV
ncbi:RTA1-domain-containing protein [Aspergillus steynii IBT 23096]|uniref:RTA1-domain-containing protein n=1 Tax=Aspergillus steynii IBT 23096 TaxID=1392250 RepID=A0A2I2G9T5_9EURO|nr:RTA1-domain-containing protein [Aspergillus steynii IBT 23096]PLB49613.1 RTA1-domain-containing protein [Aspergillus steynii IBT 23096]